MRRRRLLALLLALALPALLLAAILLLRAEIAVLAFQRWLDTQGLEGSVGSVAIGLERVEIRELRLEQLRARRVVLQFEPLRLLRGALPAATMEGLELPLDLTGAGPPLGRLQALLGAAEEAPPGAWRSPLPADPPALPPLRLEDAVLRLATPAGTVTLELDGRLLPSEEAPQQALLTLAFAIEGPGESRGLGQLASELRALRPSSLQLDASLALPALGAAGGFSVQADDLGTGQDLQLSGEIQGPAEALAALLPAAGPQPSDGALALALDGSLRLPPLPYLDAPPPQDWLAWATGLQAEAELDLALQRLALPELAEQASLQGGLSLRRAEEATLLQIREPLRGELAGIAPPLLASLPPLLAQRLAPGGSLALAARGEAPLLRLDAGAQEGAAALALTLTLADGARLAAALEAELPWPPTADRLPRLRISALEAEAAAPPYAERLRLSGGGELEPRGSGLAGDWQLRLEAEGLPAAERLTLEAGLQLEPAAAGYALAFDLDARAEATDYAESLALRARGRAEGEAGRARADFELDLAATSAGLAEAAAESLRLSAPLHLAFAESRLELALEGPAALQATRLRSEALEPIERLELVLEALRLSLDLEGEPLGEVELQARLAPLTLGLVGAPIRRLELRPRPLRLQASFDAQGPTDGLVELELDSLVLPERDLTLAELRVELPLGPGAPLARLRRLRLYSDAVPALFPPLDLTATLQHDLAFEARARGLGGALDLQARGRHDLARRRGEASLRLAPLTFTPGGLQPSAFGPLAAEITNVSGRLQGEARLGWSDRGFDGTARAVGSDLDLQYGELLLQGLGFDVALAGLQPLRTAEPQRISLRRLDTGLPPLTDVEALVAVASGPGGAPHLLLQRAEAGFAGGRIGLRDGRLDPGAGRYAAQLTLQRLELEPLLALLGLDEVSGHGRVSGTLPLLLEAGEIAVTGGQVAAEGGGVIAFRSPEARQALAAGGEAVALMFDALEDFHYEALEVGLEKELTGETQVRLRLLGANPTVLDGHPFDLNINLETDAAPLLAALAEGRRIQRGVMGELWRLVR